MAHIPLARGLFEVSGPSQRENTGASERGMRILSHLFVSGTIEETISSEWQAPWIRSPVRSAITCLP